MHVPAHQPFHSELVAVRAGAEVALDVNLSVAGRQVAGRCADLGVGERKTGQPGVLAATTSGVAIIVLLGPVSRGVRLPGR
jgi:hypothetical protein